MIEEFKNKNILITGPAGSGKSLLANYLRGNIPNCDILEDYYGPKPHEVDNLFISKMRHLFSPCASLILVIPGYGKGIQVFKEIEKQINIKITVIDVKFIFHEVVIRAVIDDYIKVFKFHKPPGFISNKETHPADWGMK